MIYLDDTEIVFRETQNKGKGQYSLINTDRKTQLVALERLMPECSCPAMNFDQFIMKKFPLSIIIFGNNSGSL